MKSVDIPFLSATELSGFLQRKELSPLEAVDAYLNRIEQVDPNLNSYITVLATEARQAALDAEREIAGGGYRGPLHGIPVAVKDQIHSKGVRTTDASKIRSDFVPAEDSKLQVRAVAWEGSQAQQGAGGVGIPLLVAFRANVIETFAIRIGYKATLMLSTPENGCQKITG
jgi:hypothetical protein